MVKKIVFVRGGCRPRDGVRISQDPIPGLGDVGLRLRLDGEQQTNAYCGKAARNRPIFFWAIGIRQG